MFSQNNPVTIVVKEIKHENKLKYKREGSRSSMLVQVLFLLLNVVQREMLETLESYYFC